MIDQQKLETQIAEYPVCEYAFIKPEEITFLEQVRHICESECPRYGTSWSCPPAVGTVAECKERCRQYTGGFIFTTVEMCIRDSLVTDLAEKYQITFMNGGNVVTWFSLILYE